MVARRLPRKPKNATPVGTIADSFIPADECVGKEFNFSASMYRVTGYYPTRGKFSAIVLNNFNAPVMLGELFVRQHCTPVEQIKRPVYSVDTRRRDETVRNLPVFNLTIERKAEGSVREDVPAQVETSAIESTMVDSSSAHKEPETVKADEPMDMNRYLHQNFELDGQTIRVVNYKPHKKQFTLCAISHGGTYFHRDEAWVMAHCEPADEAPQFPVHTPLPSIERSKAKFAEGKPMGFITSRIGITEEKRYAKDHNFDWKYLIGDCNIKVQELTYTPTVKGTPCWTGIAEAWAYHFDIELWQEDVDVLNQWLGIEIEQADYRHHEPMVVCVRIVDSKRKLLKGVSRVWDGELMQPGGERAS